MQGSTPLAAILGPTCSGKSELALVLAEHFEGEIVNCDSIQVYRSLNVGSAKLPPAARRGIPHHMVDIIDPDQELTAGAYATLARPILSEIAARHRLPFVVGGTGLYLRALLDGLSPAPQRDELLRERLRTIAESRPAALHRFLRRHDPPASRRIHPNDYQKLIRAIEMTVSAGQPASRIQSLPRQALTGFSTLKLCLLPERDLLRQRIDQRTIRMFASGLLEEVQLLLAQGFSADAKPLQSLGYKQALEVLSGRLSFAEAVTECQARTRQYAKRQQTWFRGEQNVVFLSGCGTDRALQNEAISTVKQLLLTTAW